MMTLISHSPPVTTVELAGRRARFSGPLPSTSSAALERYRGQLLSLADAARGDGYLFAAVTESGVVGGRWCLAGESPRPYSIGSHEACDLSIDDETVALRALLLLVRLRDGRPAARCFHLTGEEVAPSFELPPLCAIALPGAWVFAIATSRHSNALADGAVLTEPKTVIPLPLRAGARLMCGRTSHHLSGAEIDSGVLLGRDRRCLALPGSDDLRTSRVHALLVRDGRRVFAVDAGSSNGVLVDGRMTMLAELESGSTLVFGGVSCRWFPEGEVSAEAGALDGVGPMLRDAEDAHGLAVLADWLIERGTPWGEWIAASLRGEVDDEQHLRQQLEEQLLQPLSQLRSLRWSHGVLRGAELCPSLELTPAVRAWPHWAGLRALRAPPGTRALYESLTEAGLLDGLDDVVIWSASQAEALPHRRRPVKVVAARGQSFAALALVLPRLQSLRGLELDGATGEELGSILEAARKLPHLERIVVRGTLDELEQVLAFVAEKACPAMRFFGADFAVELHEGRVTIDAGPEVGAVLAGRVKVIEAPEL